MTFLSSLLRSGAEGGTTVIKTVPLSSVQKNLPIVPTKAIDPIAPTGATPSVDVTPGKSADSTKPIEPDTTPSTTGSKVATGVAVVGGLGFLGTSLIPIVSPLISSGTQLGTAKIVGDQVVQVASDLIGAVTASPTNMALTGAIILGAVFILNR